LKGANLGQRQNHQRPNRDTEKTVLEPDFDPVPAGVQIERRYAGDIVQSTGDGKT